jgi:hypothetical protein
MTSKTPRRYRTAAGTARRRPRVRRASAGLTPTRSAAILAMLLTAGAIYGLVATPAFGFQRLGISGNELTPEDAVRAAVGLEPGTNLVGLGTEPIVARLRELPSIGGVEVAVGLPDQLDIRLRERRPVIVWVVGERRLAVDETGYLFADVTGVVAEAAELIRGIPLVRDERSASTGLDVRGTLDPVDLDAATRLGSLTPAQVGSHASALGLRITDERGFTVTSGSGSWQAVFGFYGRSQRTPALIPGQIQLLGALLEGREDTVQTVILADDRDGTYVPKPTPKPGATAKPTKSP